MFGDESKVLVDRSISGLYLKSGEIYRDEIYVPYSKDNSSKETLKITLNAVIFSDDSFDGDFDAVTYIKERRLGIKHQLQNLIPTLEKLESDLQQNTVPDKTSLIKTAKEGVKNLTVKTDSKVSKGFADGIYDGGQSANRVLANLEQNLTQNAIVDSIRIYSYQVNELKNWLGRL